MLIDKTAPTDRPRREYFWMLKLKTLAPLALNVFGRCMIFFNFHCKAQRRFYSVAT